MALWVVRAGKYGEREELALEQGLAVIGWSGLPDLSGIATREQLAELVRQTYPREKPNTLINWTGQIWAFLRRIQAGDLVALPLKKRSAIAIGGVKGAYQYRPDLPPDVRHVRAVKWREEPIPRSAFEQDLLYSLGSALTVCQIQRNDAEERIRALKDGPAPKPREDSEEEVEGILNIEEYAADQIRTHIAHKFAGHALAHLVAALLGAQGYHTYESPEGPDGGVDIVAGQGPMGFDVPRLCVQVKSGDQPVDVRVLRELQGVMRDFGAEQGLLVSWGGFKQTVLTEARRHFFEIRLWDSGDVVRGVQEHYEQLSDELQAELPLKRMWVLVPEE